MLELQTVPEGTDHDPVKALGYSDSCYPSCVSFEAFTKCKYRISHFVLSPCFGPIFRPNTCSGASL